MHRSEDFLEGNPQELSDEEVLMRAITHPFLFSVLLERYQDAFLRKAEGVLHNREEAEDTVQETFMKIYQYASRFKPKEGASFKSWGYKILMNTAFTRYQKLRRDRGATVALDPEFYEMLPDKSVNHLSSLEVSDYLVSILSRLPDHLSRALRLHFLEGKSQEEIAKIEGTSVGAVKTRVHRAKKAFKKESAAMAIAASHTLV